MQQKKIGFFHSLVLRAAGFHEKNDKKKKFQNAISPVSEGCQKATFHRSGEKLLFHSGEEYYLWFTFYKGKKRGK